MRDVFEEAFVQFLSQESGPILDGIAERSSCSRRMYHLQVCADRMGLTDYFADAEYNRNRGQIKSYSPDGVEAIDIFCDVILHGRGVIDPDNLIAIEMKKVGRPQSEYDADRKRLVALTKPNHGGLLEGEIPPPKHVCDYMLGVFVVIDSRNRQFFIEYYQGGELFDADKRYF